MKKLLFVVLLIPALSFGQTAIQKQERTVRDLYTAALGKPVAYMFSVGGKIKHMELYEAGEQKVYTGKSLDSLLVIAENNMGGDIDAKINAAYENEYRLVALKVQRQRTPTKKEN